MFGRKSRRRSYIFKLPGSGHFQIAPDTKNNLHEDKHKLGLEFFDQCNGNKYQSLETRIIALDEHADDLLEARYSWDNFYNEPPHMQKILSYFSTENDIPHERREKIIKIILICRIGKGVAYCGGVSPGGKKLYDKFFGMLGDDNIIYTLLAMHTNEVRVLLDNKTCQRQMVEVLTILLNNARSERIAEILDYLIEKKNILHKIHLWKKYKDLTKNHIEWN